MSVHILPAALRDQNIDIAVGRAWRTARGVVREAVCAISGHNYLLRAADHRLYLRCIDCGHETTGWSVDGSVAKPALRGSCEVTPGRTLRAVLSSADGTQPVCRTH